MADIPLNRIEPLTGPNYHIWELKMSAILRSRKLYKPVIEDQEPPDLGEAGTAEQRKTREKWESQNDECFGLIIVTLPPEQAGLFIGVRKAKAVWEELKRIHAGNAEDMRIDATLELKNIKMTNSESVDEYITRARNIATRCAALGQVIPERELVYYVVRGVTAKYETVASVLRPQRSAKLEDVQQSLREEELRNNRRSGSYVTKPEEAYRASVGKGQLKDRNKKACHYCGKPGHFIKDCWHRANSEKHRAHTGQARTPDTRVNGGQNREKPNWKRKQYAGSAGVSKQENAFVATSNQNKHMPSKYVYQDDDIEMWNLDSGCTNHMTPRKDWMENIQPVNSKINLAESERCIMAEAKGDINLTTTTQPNGEKKQICVKDVLYVPELRTSLLSVKNIVDKGNRVIFDANGATIFNAENEVLADVCEKDNLYILETEKATGNNKSDDCLLTEQHSSKVSTNMEKIMWHKRLGHINEVYLDKMKTLNMVKGLEFSQEKMGLCESCVLNKMTQKPFKACVGLESTAPLQLVYMDLCGPMPEESLGNSRYIYVLVDSYSRRLFVYFLRTKSEAFDCFVNFKERRETELNKKIIKKQKMTLKTLQVCKWKKSYTPKP